MGAKKSWLLHFVLFYLFSLFLLWMQDLGKVRGTILTALIIILATEVWEAFDWKNGDVLGWFKRLDTWMDIAAGLLACVMALAGYLLLR